jgi:CheY-like chemotaxis protein
MSKLDTILVVDDDEINRKVAGLFLQRMGWKTDQAASAFEALEHLQQHDYHCVMLDISMRA